MCLAVHPGYETASLFAVICDNYFVTEYPVSEVTESRLHYRFVRFGDSTLE